MKFISIITCSILVLLSSCTTIRQNIDARTFLAKCKYDLQSVTVKGIRYASGADVQAVDLDVDLRMTNTTDREVALDHGILALFLDKNFVLETAHNTFVRVPPGAQVIESIPLTLPFEGPLKVASRRPQMLGIKAKLWVTLMVGKATWETPIVILAEVEVPVPYDQIDAAVAKKRQEIEDKAAAQALESLGKTLPPAPAPVPLPSLPPALVPSVPHF